ncbi:hypothetical protein MRX96_041418 [Rhipicephalus microplus]
MGLGVSGFTGRPLGGRPRGRFPVRASLEGPAALSSAAAWRFARPTSGEPWLAPHPFLCHGVVSPGLDTTIRPYGGVVFGTRHICANLASRGTQPLVQSKRRAFPGQPACANWSCTCSALLVASYSFAALIMLITSTGPDQDVHNGVKSPTSTTTTREETYCGHSGEEKDITYQKPHRR